MEEEVEYMTDDEVVMSEQEESNHGNTQNIQHFEEKDDVDEWLNAEIKKHMSMQGVENIKDALISIIKSIRHGMKDGIMKRQFEASTTSVSDEVSFIASNKVYRADDNTSNTAPCRLPMELSPGSFLIPFNINSNNLYATTTLYAKENIMPQRVFEYLEFPCSFVIKMAEDVIILGRQFLESTHAQIDVFNEEISFEIGSKQFKFNIDSYQSIEKVYMVDIGQEEETLNPLEIGIKLFSYESPTCLEFEQRARSYGTPNPQDEIAEPIRSGRHDAPDSKILLFGYNEVFRYTSRDTYAVDMFSRSIKDKLEKGFTWDLLTFIKFDMDNKNIDDTIRELRMFNNKIEHLSNEYILKIGKKRYVLNDVCEKCQQNYKKTNEAWHDEDEM
ncbi:hypothetical protein Tco_1540039 [Tanacetum coccineum]